MIWLYVLSTLLVGLVWLAWWMLRGSPAEGDVDLLPLWVPIAVTLVALAVVITVVVVRRVRAARASRSLEQAIAEQAQEQAMAAKPEDREEIRALAKQLADGIRALKASKLGGGWWRTNALYSLPWYAMVGPPGAGKTTALRHSGLPFPFLDPQGNGVRGVGGTRNCDWWFTNDAVLLDTAGRYATEAGDRDEWMAFLELLVKYRPNKPLNGVVVAISVAELIEATDEQLRQIGEKVGNRIAEMNSTLKMVLPVYVVFTKADLIAGFVDFFADLRKSERGQVWGATLAFEEENDSVSDRFEREFDVLVRALHDRGLKRLAVESQRDARERIFQFPLEFSAIKRPLSTFLGTALGPAGTAETESAIFRGFYFTSGTQEGQPLDRVVGAMGRAFGLRVALPSVERAERKSYFLRDVFEKVIFPEKGIAARSMEEQRRQRWLRAAVATGAFALSLLVLVPSVLSYVKNAELVEETERLAQEALATKWNDGGPTLDKVERLDQLRAHLEQLDAWEQSSPPWNMRWSMYQGDRLFRATLEPYVAALNLGFVGPSKERLEDDLRVTTGAKYLEDYQTLKSYLLLNDREHLQDELDWQSGRLLETWLTVLRPQTDVADATLRTKLAPHVRFYVDMMKRGVIPMIPIQMPLVERTRDLLTRVGSSQRYYDQFVTVLISEKYDPTGPSTPVNLKYPPVSIDQVFADRPEVLSKIGSRRRAREGKWGEVLGPYTASGHAVVLERLKEGRRILEREKWVLPPTRDEKGQDARIDVALERVRQDYDAEYVRQWVGFFRDIDVAIPRDNREAIDEFRVLATPELPYARLLRVLSDNTQFPKPKKLVDVKAGGVLDQIRRRVQRRVESGIRFRLDGVIPNPNDAEDDPIPERFASMVQFGVVSAPEPAKEGEPPPPPPSGGEGLKAYAQVLEKLSGEMGNIEDGPPDASTEQAREAFLQASAKAQALLLSMDDTGQELMGPLLLNPLKQAYQALVRRAGGAASGLWEVVVFPPYRETIRDRYPFGPVSARDASLEDAMAFFKPKDGVIWGFYEEYLKGMVMRVGNAFAPLSHLESRPRPAVPFTPFAPGLYRCLGRSAEITSALFGDGTATENPGVALEVKLKTVSPIVSEVTFEVDGQRKVYRNEKQFWQKVTWLKENAESQGARIRLRGAGGLDEEIVREGPWGLLRLIEAGETNAKSQSDAPFNVTWEMAAPPVSVTLEMRPRRAEHPLSPGFFRATNCPPTIGDRFAKR